MTTYELHWDHAYEGDNAALVDCLKDEAVAQAKELLQKPYMRSVIASDWATGEIVFEGRN